MLACLIIGGGLQGVHLGRVLTHDGTVSGDDLRILDAHGRYFTLWRRHTRACGMTYLRSPHTHNIDVPFMSLRRFARTSYRSPEEPFIEPYFRPALDLFDRHCDHVVHQNGLASLCVGGRARQVEPITGGLRVYTETETLDTRHLVLAMGRNEQPCWPEWARHAREAGARIDHMYDAGFEIPENDGGDIAVIGGGVSAVSLVLALENSGRILLVSPHPMRVDNLDFDPCWAGPKCIRPFESTVLERRRETIDRERRPGTVPVELAGAFNDAVSAGRIQFYCVPEIELTVHGSRLQCRTTDGSVSADRAILATGFDRSAPGGPLLKAVTRTLDLQMTSCGYPLVDRNLLWHDRISVVGALAEMQLGPAAGNIIGARIAAQRVYKFLNKSGKGTGQVSI